MLIRTQDKRNLVDLQNIIISINKYPIYYPDKQGAPYYFNIETRNFVLGKYSYEEKALKVLDMIEAKYLEPGYINCVADNEYAKYDRKVFHMPEDEEVNV